MKNIMRIKNIWYIYQEIKIGIFRFSFYRLGKKICIRFEISNGWDK